MQLVSPKLLGKESYVGTQLRKSRDLKKKTGREGRRRKGEGRQEGGATDAPA